MLARGRRWSINHDGKPARRRFVLQRWDGAPPKEIWQPSHRINPDRPRLSNQRAPAALHHSYASWLPGFSDDVCLRPCNVRPGLRVEVFLDIFYSMWRLLTDVIQMWLLAAVLRSVCMGQASSAVRQWYWRLRLNPYWCWVVATNRSSQGWPERKLLYPRLWVVDW